MRCLAAASFLAGVLITSGCAGKDGQDNSSLIPAANLNTQPNEPLVIYQKKTNAFGSSNAFTFTIYANGKLDYKPIPVSRMPIFGSDNDTKKEVPVEGTITQEQLSRLLDEFDRAHFMSMKDTYATTDDGCPRVISDQGGASITLNGRTAQKTVEHYLGCVENAGDISNVYPAELRKIEVRLDDLVPKQP